MVEAVSVELIGASERRPPRPPGGAAGPAADCRAAGRGRASFAGGAWTEVTAATAGGGTCGPATRVDGPGDHRRGQRHHRRRARLAGDRDRAGPPAAEPRRRAARRGRRSAPRSDPVRLEIFNNLFMSIAEQMGYRLQSTAHSVNIKERLDFSCAIFDARATSSPTPRTCRCTSARWARASRWSSSRNAGTHAARRRVRAQRPLPRRHPPARHHRRHPGVRRGERRESSSTWRRAATTPRSAASPPARCRRSAPAIEEEGVLIDNWLLVEGRSPPGGGDDASCSAARRTRRATRQ